jgi:magnesium and cobalt exporter, CNNM family
VSVGIDIGVVLLLILIEAMFASVEIALISLRDTQVKALEAKGRRGAAVARLTADPNRFLSAVQIGVTLTSLFSSAYGAVTLSHAAGDGLRSLGMGKDAADVLGFILVTMSISFVTLVVGELAPKRIGLQRAEGTASALGPPLERFAVLVRPVIWLLSASTNVVVRVLGGDPGAAREAITEEELRGLVASHEALNSDERELIDDVFEAGDRRLREVLVPRTEVEFLDAATTVAQVWQAVRSGGHSRYPVVRGSADEVVGFVHLRDLLVVQADGDARTTRVGDLARPVKMVPDGLPVLTALSQMRRERQHMAIVVDEYGGTAGIVTMEDLIEELIGDIRDEYDVESAGPRRLRGGDVVVDGLMNTDDFAEETGVALPEGPYETVAGFVVARLGHLPQVGESVEVDGHRLTVSELDGRRVARVRLTPQRDQPPPTNAHASMADGLGE